MNLQKFKEKYPALFWRKDNLNEYELLTNIIQLENKNALKDFIKQFWFDKVKSLFLSSYDTFSTNPDLKFRYEKMYNWFIFYKKKKLWLITDMRKYKYWWTKKI